MPLQTFDWPRFLVKGCLPALSYLIQIGKHMAVGVPLGWIAHLTKLAVRNSE